MITYAELIELIDHNAVGELHINEKEEGYTLSVVLNKEAGYRAGTTVLSTTRHPRRIRLWRDRKRCIALLQLIAPSIPVNHVR